MASRHLQVVRPCAAGIVPNSLWLLDSSSSKLQRTAFLKFGSHYQRVSLKSEKLGEARRMPGVKRKSQSGPVFTENDIYEIA